MRVWGPGSEFERRKGMRNQFGPARMALLAVIFVVMAIFVANVTIAVPVEIAKLPRSEATQYWPVAVVSLVIVVVVDAFTLGLIVRRRGRQKAEQAAYEKGAKR